LPTEALTLTTFPGLGLWVLAGTLLGWILERLVLVLPVWVLTPYGDQVQAEDWHGPGGGLDLLSHPARRTLLACLNGGLWAAVALWSPSALQGLTLGVIAWALCGTTLLVLAMVDWNTTMLPDVLVWPLVWAGLLASERDWTGLALAASLWSAVLWYLGMQTLAWIFARITGREGMGAGDAKLLAAMAAWWGWQPVLWALLTGSLLTLLAGLFWRWRGLQPWSHVPFGPFLVLGMACWTALAWPV
jgi:leader peptidase (prepilin peptidase)/N-methyltransferase